MTDDTQKFIDDIVQKTLKFLGFSAARVTTQSHLPNMWHSDIEAPEGAGALIGERGQGLLALEHMLRRMLSKNIGNTIRFSIDINGYRAENARLLRERARAAADEAKQHGAIVRFEPMTAFERRIIHLELAARGDIVTESNGEGLNRHVVVRPYP